MNHLGYHSAREMLLQIAIANNELAPTVQFNGKDLQCWFTGTQQLGRQRLPFQISPRIVTVACTVHNHQQIWVNAPESATACAFHTFLTRHYPNVTIRPKAKAQQRRGRPKDSEKKNGRG